MTNRLIADYWELTIPRICMLALIMAAIGFFIATDGTADLKLLAISLVGIGLVGASSGVINQYMERHLDGQMWRTLNRPLPSGRMEPRKALVFGVVLAVLGEAILLLAVNVVTAVLGAATLFIYLGVYTPSKRISTMSTLVGAIPGAMPPLLGWTAAEGRISGGGLILFSILFLWQIPHFLAIAWMYKEDYSRANFQVLSVIDEKGSATSRQIIIYTLVLLLVTLIPSAWGSAGQTYFYGALVMGLLFLAQGIWLAFHRTKAQARRLFLASLIYLPMLGLLLAWDRV
jgi:protoheme IX farnesyltransferase